MNEELKNIAYATSHDLQEPLRMVVSYTQLLAREYKGKLDGQADQFIAYAVEGALRMEMLLKDLREYWSVNEHWRERPIPVDSNRVCAEILQILNAAIQESGARVTHDPLPTVIAEEVPLRLLFQNLIGNAIKYRRPDEPARIHIQARRTHGLWRFSVADNGIGIEAQHLETIFAPFKRLHGLDEYPGSGIGLAICKTVVERSGGQIWVESTYGQGSTFYYTLPAKDGDA
jgi:light-regulated signal transduction histidine kinase (bacteriophytochrome)